MSAESVASQLQRIADDAIAQVMPDTQEQILADLAVKKALREAADVIVDRYMPMCVCPVHGGYDVADVVKRIAAMLNDKADRVGK
jgi:hypothetical protein